MKRNKWLWLWLVFGLLLIILVPLAMDWLIIGNGFPSNINNSDWVGFFGGYIGALVGAFLSLVGIIVTIRHTSKENRRDRELQIRPYCLASGFPHGEKCVNKEKVYMSFVYNPRDEILIPENLKSKTYYIEIGNIGIGPAISFEIQQKDYCTYMCTKKGEPRQLQGYSTFYFDCITPADKIYIEYVVFFQKEMSNEHCTENLDTIIKQFFSQYPACKVPYVLSYCDMLGNRYTQSLDVYMDFNAIFDKDNIPSETNCNIRLDNLTSPEMKQTLL